MYNDMLYIPSALLQTVDLLRNNEDMNTDDPTDTSASNDYLDLLLDEEETFIREYRQRLVEDGFW